ncbi:hypothetical protein FQN49_000275 [Arthroderma sp. PD_2]|nr:hypothetical protein FQN49_000275 [Arthroderma sp. PD_2]
MPVRTQQPSWMFGDTAVGLNEVVENFTADEILSYVISISTTVWNSDFDEVYRLKECRNPKLRAFISSFRTAVYIIKEELRRLQKSNNISYATEAIYKTADCLDSIAGPTGKPSPTFMKYANLKSLVLLSNDRCQFQLAKFLYERLSIRSSNTRNAFLRTLKECEAALGCLSGIPRAQEPSGQSDEHYELEQTWINVNRAYGTLLVCCCDQERLRDLSEMRLHLAANLDHSAVETQHTLDLLMANHTSIYVHELHLKVSGVARPQPQLRFQLVGSDHGQPTGESTVQTALREECYEIKCFCDADRANPDSLNFRSNLVAQGTQLWRHRPTLRQYKYTVMQDEVKLTDLLHSKSSAWSVMTKLVLAVILAHSFLWLHGDPWLNGRWDRSNVIFYFNGKSIPVRPFIRRQLPSTASQTSGQESFHQYPGILKFGVALLEIYLGKSIDMDHYSTNKRLAIASRVWEEEQVNIFPGYRSVIQACLTPDFGAGKNCTPTKFRSLICNRILNPLRKELSTFMQGLSEINSLDDISRNINLATGQYSHHVQTEGGSQRAYQNPPAPGEAQDRNQPYNQGEAQSLGNIPETAPSALEPAQANMPVRAPRSVDSQSTFELFETEDQGQDIPANLCYKTDSWIGKFKGLFYSRLTRNHIESNRLKVAILDSGIDMNNTDIEADADDRIKSVRSWVDGNDGKEDRNECDESGHGTHIAGILLSCAPNTDLYIARITKTRELNSVNEIVSALDYAIHVWKVDMIMMSFGFSDRIPGIKEKVQEAISASIIVFAAASNDGGNSPRAFPARHPGVICIHSADSDGNKSMYNPTPRERDDNFSILGQYIKSSWLSAGEAGASRRMSGTSFATPIALALACFIVGFVQMEIQDPDIVSEVMSKDGMTAVFRKLAEFNTPRDGYDWLSPFQFFKLPNRKIREDIKHILRSG